MMGKQRKKSSTGLVTTEVPQLESIRPVSAIARWATAFLSTLATAIAKAEATMVGAW